MTRGSGQAAILLPNSTMKAQLKVKHWHAKKDVFPYDPYKHVLLFFVSAFYFVVGVASK